MFCSTPQISNRVQMMLKHGFETCIISLERVNIRSRFQFMFFLTSRYTLFQRTRDRVRNIIVSRNPRIFTGHHVLCSSYPRASCCIVLMSIVIGGRATFPLPTIFTADTWSDLLNSTVLSRPSTNSV